MTHSISHIGLRLKEFRQNEKITMAVVSAATGIIKETLYKWEKGTKPSDFGECLKLKAYLDEMQNKQEENLLELEAKKPATLRLPLTSNRKPVVQSDGIAAAGTVILCNEEPELIVDRIYAPCLGNIDGMVEVKGNSMEPTYKSGSRVAISRLNNHKILEWGHCYFILDKNWQGIVRRVYKSDTQNRIKLVSDYPDQSLFPPFYRSWNEIVAIFKVNACITKQ